MLVLIHGLGGDPRELDVFRRSLGRETRAFSPTLLSHGGRPLHHQPDFEPMIEDLVDQIDRHPNGWPAILFGYSLGGLIALYLASRYPDRIRGVVALGARILHDRNAVSFLHYVISPERIARISPEKRLLLEGAYGGSEIFRERLIRARDLFERLHSDPPLTEEDLRSIEAPILLLCGDSDQFAPIGEMEHVATLLPNAELSVFLGSAHPLDQAPLGTLTATVRRFLRGIASANADSSGLSDDGAGPPSVHSV